MIPTLTAFEQSPDNGLGLARDMPVRWALEEVGQRYNVSLVSFSEQIPTYQEDSLVLFESGAIVLHVAESHAGLLPEDGNARSRAIMWMFAALNTVEPVVWDYDIAPMLEGDKPWHAERMVMLADRLRARLDRLSDRLGDNDWLEGAFSAGGFGVKARGRGAAGTPSSSRAADSSGVVAPQIGRSSVSP